MLANEYRLEIQFKKVQKIRNINNIPTVGSRPLECKPAQNVCAERTSTFTRVQIQSNLGTTDKDKKKQHANFST
jgi:hypothetical protein